MPEMSGVVNTQGTPYRTFRRGLVPRFSRVWLPIACAYLLLAVTMWLLTAVTAWPVWSQLCAAAVGALVTGYAIAFIALYIHEAAHYNVAPGRRHNDRVANLCIGILLATEVARYRQIHMRHHKFLGTPDDPERSYFCAFGPRFVIESLTGIRALRVLLIHRRQLGESGDDGGDDTGGAQRLSPIRLTGMVLHAGIFCGCLFAGFWAAALAWAVGTAAVFPFFASLRQLLEHRDIQAEAQTDYSRTPHGRVNRLFGDGPLASTLGGAGFNRHLLHHWDPGISCTRLRDVEQFLLDSEARNFVRQHQTTYWHTMRSLYGH